MAKLAGMAELTAAMEGLVGLRAKGVAIDDFMRYIGLDPDQVRQAADEAAQEEFDVLPGMPPAVGATGRLRRLGLSARQRATVKEALSDTYLLAIQLGITLERARTDG
jgi:hypothetical protein